MTKRYLVIEDSVVMESIEFTADGRILCYMHPDLLDQYNDCAMPTSPFGAEYSETD